MLTPRNSLNSPLRLFVYCLFITLLLPCSGFTQVQIWGVSQQGGSDQIGSVFNLYDDGTGYLLKSEFQNSIDGTKPKSSVLVGQDGNYYGITSAGGDHNAGTIFKYSDSGFEVLYHLTPFVDGTDAKGDMIEITPGVFVGTTNSGGPSFGGTLFKYSLAQGMTILHTFESVTHGSNPSGGLAFDPQSQNIYGTCSSGGTSGYGTCFSFNLTTNTYAVQHHFSGNTGGSYPQGGVIIASDGMLYGTTQHGGSNAQGSIFKLHPQDETFEIIYSLSNTTSDGRYPFGKLAEAQNGILVGTCSEGGTSANGTIFKVSTSGDFTRLKSLQSANDGGFPKAGLSVVDENTLYGMAEFGGINGFGTLFSITIDGIFTKVRDMDYTNDGSSGVASLIHDGNNHLVGVCASGGANNFGTIFTLDMSESTFAKIFDFSVPLEGANPTSLLRVENTFYGITQDGGIHNTGTFYKTNLDGSRDVLHHFKADTDGLNPNGDLYRDEDGSFYGTARFGGTHNSGTVFKISSEGEFNLLHSFEVTSSQFPYGGVIKHSNGILYGTTSSGGMYGDGVLYSLTDQGEFTILADFFSYFEGGSPQSTLTVGADGNLYGTTTTHGNFNGGTLFTYNFESAMLMDLHHFNPSSDGSASKGKLLLHSDGLLYGTTTIDAAGGGTLYRYSANTGFEILHVLNIEEDGSDCNGGLSEDEFGNVYGFCTYGGANNSGTSFVYSADSGFEAIYTFSSESRYPAGTPALFFPECYDNSGCSTETECAVAICNFGLCDEVEINPVFTLLEMGQCEVGLDVYEVTMSLDMDIHPGGNLIVEGDTVELLEGVNSYIVTITLPADGNPIDLVYHFEENNCGGTTGNLGVAPEPCPPIEVHFILDVGNLIVGEQGIYLGGSFQGWTPSENPLTLGENGYWETTLEIGSGIHEFNFFNGPILFNAEYVIGPCATNGKRQLTVGEESQTLTFCWANCNVNCSVGLYKVSALIEFDLIPNITHQGGSLVAVIPSGNKSLAYSVMNITGSVVQNGVINGTRTEFNTGSMASGIYNFTVSEAGRIVGVKRFIVH